MTDRLRDWWFLHCSRTRLARLLRAERRRLDAELAGWLPEASATVRRRVLAAIDDDRRA
ncbi:hypothetical protein BX285_2966 [Streptomyces sp. 1114.5]|uniref:hypothetical protein n=1 Tax=Streptomyces sp. 1114.5 TaxID=1938830 RepID=UPI000F13FBEC|nr:hypothetical protein [Streptomyces sp. 1114.5]RKT18537.1 hypothetical protein BX285_2966 [Streptomyces sp. 1114.5]